jgi:hypothetical protein
MNKPVKIFKYLSEKGYKHYTENTVEELDKLPLDSPDIFTEFAHLCEWLRVNHRIWIYVLKGKASDNYGYRIQDVDGDKSCYEVNFTKVNPQEAYSAAFDYIKNNNLI